MHRREERDSPTFGPGPSRVVPLLMVQPEIRDQLTSWGNGRFCFPLFTKVLASSQVVGNGISEPSTVCGPGVVVPCLFVWWPPLFQEAKKKHPIFKKFLALCFQMFEKRLKVEVNFSGSTLPETNSFSKTIRSHLDCLVSGANCSF